MAAMARAEVVRLAETGRQENVEAEAALLGALLANNDLWRPIAGIVAERDFAEPIHGRIFAAIADELANGRPTSPVLLKPRFEADEALKELGGPGYLARLSGDGSGLLAPREIAEQIRDLAQLRRLREGASEIAAACGRPDASASELIAGLQDLAERALEGGAIGSLASLDLASLADVKPMPKAMAIERLAPAGEVTLMTGPGSAGKSLAGQQICTAAAAGRRFVGLDVVACPALYLTCEDGADQLHWRQQHLCDRIGVPMASLAGRLHLISRRGELDSALGTFGPDGTLAPTAAFHRLRSKIIATGCRIACLDNVAHVFAGNENDRGEVTAFVNLLNRLAGETGAAIILIAHPSKGKADYSGSTAWQNALRSHIDLNFERDRDGDVPDPDARVLAVSKANYSRAGEALRFRWQDWSFVLEDELPADTRAELAETIKATGENAAFLACLRERAAQGEGRAVGPSPGPNYAPTQFEGMAQANGLSKAALKRAMDRLFAIGKIESHTYRNTAKARDVTVIREVPEGTPNASPNASRTQVPNAPDPLPELPRTHTTYPTDTKGGPSPDPAPPLSDKGLLA